MNIAMGAKLMEWVCYVYKNWPAFLLLLAGILAVLGTFFASTQDSRQQDTIQKLGEENKKLSSNIERLSEINKQISGRVEEISEENRKLSRENLEISTASNTLVKKIHTLTRDVSLLIDKVDKRMQYSFEETLASGELNVDFNALEGDDLRIVLGSITMTNTFDRFIKGSQASTTVPITFKIKNRKLLISLKVVDLQGNLIAEIDENMWRPNRAVASKVNYDDSGLEVINQQGNVAFSIDILAGNTISIRGIFPHRDSGSLTILGKSMLLRTLDPKQDYTDAIKEAEIVPLFRYTGSDWLHKRR